MLAQASCHLSSDICQVAQLVIIIQNYPINFALFLNDTNWLQTCVDICPQYLDAGSCTLCLFSVMTDVRRLLLFLYGEDILLHNFIIGNHLQILQRGRRSTDISCYKEEFTNILSSACGQFMHMHRLIWAFTVSICPIKHFLLVWSTFFQ